MQRACDLANGNGGALSILVERAALGHSSSAERIASPVTTTRRAPENAGCFDALNPRQEPRTMLGDIKSKPLILVKGFLFVALGIFALGILALDTMSVRAVALCGIAIWGFCRFYYFMFYCIEKYVDPGYKFAGLSSFVLYWIARRNRRLGE
ncbi:MAG TPA: hypothetical protein VKT77_02385 [Chthonomonadaceae bacterium]|nr:hypothetical protein [Chthonomonadaceae bacterium]